MVVKKILLILMLVISATESAKADSLSAGVTAFRRGDYSRAAYQLGPIALRGNAQAEALLGYMYANGLGTPQSFVAAMELYTRAAEQGNSIAQYLLGLMYDKGLGVIQDEILAYKWLNLAAAGASNREREYYSRLRNAVASKMSRAQIAEGQWLALNWFPKPRL
jgi:uncharacterized protein